MEKEKKGLFGRLLDFWREKAAAEETDSIGFWNDTEDVEKHFAEMGAVASLTQEETKKSFWQATAEGEWENSVSEKRKPISEVENVGNDQWEKPTFGEEMMESEREETKIPEVFREGFIERTKISDAFPEDSQERSMKRSFLIEMPVEEKERRILPLADDVKTEVKFSEVEEQKHEMGNIRKEEAKAEPAVDIEKLMRQMTKMLWEERESCGRRLR